MARQTAILARHLAESPTGRRRLARALSSPIANADHSTYRTPPNTNMNNNAFAITSACHSGKAAIDPSRTQTSLCRQDLHLACRHLRTSACHTASASDRVGSALSSRSPAEVSEHADESAPSTTANRQESEPQQQLSPKSQARRVPSSRFGRLASFGGLAVGLGLGTASQYAKRALGGSDAASSSSLLSPANLDRIVATLCRVRGAALKLGQMISLQDEALVDPRLLEVFDRVRSSADFMPPRQTQRVLAAELGTNWRRQFSEFNDKPFAAASIGELTIAVTSKVRDGPDG